MRAWPFAIGAQLALGCAAPAETSPPARAASAATAPPTLDATTRSRAWSELTAKLAGSWEAPVKSGYVRVTYQPISNGTALLERFFTVSGKETASVYHPAGDRVLVTHYCAQGNQPRLQLTQFSGNQLTFDFLDATDLDNGEGVMRRLVVDLRENAFDQTAIYRDGDGADEPTTLHFVRARDTAPAAGQQPEPVAPR